MHRIAIVILNFRTPALALDCIESAISQIGERDVIAVVDNDSGDGSAEQLSRAFAERGWDQVHLLRAECNAGFAAGNNLALRRIGAEAYLLLNSDTRLREGALARLWTTLLDEPGAGIVSPGLESGEGAIQISCFRDHSPWSELIDAAGTGPIRRLLGRWDVPLPGVEVRSSPPWTSFAAVMIRRSTFERIGLLDEGFFLYFEDAEYCRRAWRSGIGVLNEPRARVAHVQSASSALRALRSQRARLPSYYYASRRRYFLITRGRAGLLLANLCWSLGRAVAIVREGLGRKRAHTATRGLFDVWRRNPPARPAAR